MYVFASIFRQNNLTLFQQMKMEKNVSYLSSIRQKSTEHKESQRETLLSDSNKFGSQRKFSFMIREKAKTKIEMKFHVIWKILRVIFNSRLLSYNLAFGGFTI